MLVRLLYLAAIWFAISLAVTLSAGTRLRRGSTVLSVGWLAVVLGLGAGLALLTFARPLEVLAFTGLAAALGVCCVWWLHDWNAFGQVTWSTMILASLVFQVYVFSLIVFSSLPPASYLIAHTVFFVQVVAALVALTHAYENLGVTCRLHWHKRINRIEPVSGYQPLVSLHLPTYDEPPQVVAQTLRALAALDYPAYEVLVVDNNTPEAETWRPIEQLCRELGPRFHFLHLEQWPGYKSGALNFALAQTDPSAELVGIIDADYQVVPDFLSETVQAFADPQVAFIQAPQDYRDYIGGARSEAVYYGYEYFFEVPMPVRNEHSAIIFAGTMGLIRKSVLQEIGGWDEQCITEDAEASLRILKRGYKSLYYHKSLGRGLMPCTFAGLKRQRFRWCFGNVQILRKHWESLMPWAHWVDPQNHLTFAQRYFYLAGSLQWFADAFNFVFVIFLVMVGLLNLFVPGFTIQPVTGSLIILSSAFLMFNLWRFSWVLRHVMKLSWGAAFQVMYGMFSVGWVVTLAAFRGLVQSEIAFLRTPKQRKDVPVLNALLVTKWEVSIGLVCLVIGVALLLLAEPIPATLFLGGMLLWQSSLYLIAPIYSLFYKACSV
jgi:cellulose synthase/poly-beta-1,6-N-acetylglucosamine synthase-like glycosyltransferase